MFAKPILGIWLTNIPDHSVAFTQIILYTMLIESFSHALIVSIHAVGDLKRFQILETSVLLLVIPLAYILLKVCDITAEQVMMAYFVIQVFCAISKDICCASENFHVNHGLHQRCFSSYSFIDFIFSCSITILVN